MENTIFDYIDSILYKCKNLEIGENDSTWNLFMTNRWLSMYSSDMAILVNMTTNKYVLNLSKQGCIFKRHEPEF